jgi:hypothetical protein
MEVVSPINLIFVCEVPLSLFTNITNTPIMGIKSKDDNNMDKKKKKQYLWLMYNDNVSLTLFMNTLSIVR